MVNDGFYFVVVGMNVCLVYVTLRSMYHIVHRIAHTTTIDVYITLCHVHVKCIQLT